MESINVMCTGKPHYMINGHSFRIGPDSRKVQWVLGDQLEYHMIDYIRTINVIFSVRIQVKMGKLFQLLLSAVKENQDKLFNSTVCF